MSLALERKRPKGGWGGVTATFLLYLNQEIRFVDLQRKASKSLKFVLEAFLCGRVQSVCVEFVTGSPLFRVFQESPIIHVDLGFSKYFLPVNASCRSLNILRF